jgi:FkbM family methyltransferase
MNNRPLIKRWKDKLLRKERFRPYSTSFRGHTLHVHDYASFKLGKGELFKEEVYRFRSNKEQPYIIDCGSNIGMSIIYFKSLFPNAKIVGFEADPYIFSFLEKNIASFQFKDVELNNKAVWDKNDETLSFLAEGGAGGRVEQRSAEHKFVDVKTARLRDFLVRDVDFLKIDIEGAEFNVIRDCADQLHNVKHLFIEYHSMADRAQNLHEILRVVHDAGFRYHIREAYAQAFPFTESKLNFGMDLQLNIFCFRVPVEASE